MNISKKLIIAGLGLALSLVSSLAQAGTRCSFRDNSSDITRPCLLDITLLNKQFPWVTAKLEISDLKRSSSADKLGLVVWRNGKVISNIRIPYPANGTGESLYISQKFSRPIDWSDNPNGTQTIWVELAYYPGYGVSSDETYYLGATLGKYGP